MSVRKVFLIGVAIFGVGCASTPSKRSPEVAMPQARQMFERAQIDRAAGSDSAALSKLKTIVQGNPNTDVADDAYVMMGEIHYSKGDYESAYASFMGVVNADVFSPRELDALIWAAKSLYKLGRFDEALGLTDKGVRLARQQPEVKVELYQLRYHLLGHLGDRLEALEAIVYLADKEKDPRTREKYRLMALDFVESRLSEPELEAVANNSKFGGVRAFARYRLGVSLFEQRDFERARSLLEEVPDLVPESEIAERSLNILEQIEARRKVNPRAIGAVLPLTGKSSRYAQRTLRGLQLGLGIYGPDSSDFTLAVVDSEENADMARRAVERLVTEDHVLAVVGSLLSKTSVAVASKANELGVPSIGLSQKAGLTDIGDFVFRNALTSEMLVSKIVSSAMERDGLRKFAILYPNDPYGVEYANLFWDEVLARGGQITSVQAYDNKSREYSTAIQRLSGLYYVEDREEEYRQALKEWYQQQKTISARLKVPDELFKPLVNFEAVFIPDEVKNATQVASTLAYHDVSGVRLLGTNLWNDEILVERGQKMVENAIFVDSLLASDRGFKQSSFFRNFKAVFGYEPGVFEAQAYDAGLILRQVIAGGERTRAGVRDQLAQLKNFSGSLGLLAMNPRREIDRPLVALTVQGGQIGLLGGPAGRSKVK